MSGPAADVTLMTEVQARAALKGRRLHVAVLAPLGEWIGVGRLRVLRAGDRDGAFELVCGYESYVRL